MIFLSLYTITTLQQLNDHNMNKSLLLLLITTALASQVIIILNCGTCPPSVTGKNCYSLNGGPFTNFSISIDKKYSSCAATQTFYPYKYMFYCNKTDCPSDCHFYSQNSEGYIDYCPVSDSNVGMQLLNQMYQAYSKSSISYNWCEAAGCHKQAQQKQDVNVGLIVGLTVGGAILVGLIIARVYYSNKKKKVKLSLLSEDTDKK